MDITQAFVLAGGKGERLKPLTNDIPKPLVKVKDKPILEYSIELLAKHEVKEIILGVGHMHEQIQEYFGDGSKFGLSIVYSVETEPLGTGGALKQAEEMLNDRFFMLNGDNIADYDLTSMTKDHETYNALETDNALATLAITKVEVKEVSSYGVMKFDETGLRIIEFVEKPEIGKHPSTFVNAGCYIIEKEALKLLPNDFNLIEKTMFPKLAEKKRLFMYKHKRREHHWFTTDTIERIEKAERELK